MRTLMLHGHSTSALLFAAQTVPFRSKLGKNFSFDFVDGPYPCAPPPGLASVVSSAYKWTKSHDLDSIRAGARWLADYIAENGPYDCICCFSKASVVVLAMLAYEARDGREKLAPKSVVFVNGSLELDLLEDLGLPVSERARDIKFRTEEMVRAKTSAVSDLASTLVRPGAGRGLWDDQRKLLHDPAKLPPRSDCFGVDFTALPLKSGVVRIPTVHIVGAKDPIWPSGVQLAYLCDPDKRTFYDHRGGHDLPRTPKVSSDIAAIFRKLAAL